MKMGPMETILIVDDHAAFRAQARALLEADGYRVVGEAGDAHEALVAARSLHPDIVLLDIGLPDEDGFSVAEALRTDSDSAGAAPSVVLTSSREAAVYGSRIAASSAAGFVAKDEISGAAIHRVLAGA